ncbi:MAG: hypothetical protein SGPRY_005064 [Prymnesium sp.]
MERSCRFVGVILHDGAKALVLRTKSKASMSGIMDGLAAVVGTATSEVLCGVYAAQFVARCKIGALWEFPSRGVGRESFEVKGATTRSGKHTAWHSRLLKWNHLSLIFGSFETVGELEAVDDCVREVKSIVNEDGELSIVPEDRLHVPPRWCAIEMQRHDPAYEAAVEIQYETRAFHDL